MFSVNSLSFGNSIGGGLGLMMGLLLGALDTPIMQDEMTGKQQIHSPSKVDGPEELEFCKSICSYGIGLLSCRVCCEKVFWICQNS